MSKCTLMFQVTVIFDVLKAEIMKSDDFWNVILCYMVDRYHKFGSKSWATYFYRILVTVCQMTWHRIPDNHNLHNISEGFFYYYYYLVPFFCVVVDKRLCVKVRLCVMLPIFCRYQYREWPSIHSCWHGCTKWLQLTTRVGKFFVSHSIRLSYIWSIWTR